MICSLFINFIRKVREKSKNTRAQSALEIGLIMPIVILILLGSFDVIRACTTYLDMNAAITEGLTKLMTDQLPNAQYKAISNARSYFQKNAFFKSNKGLEIKHLGPFPANSPNTIGTIWCMDGEVEFDVFYKELFNGSKAKVTKRVCSLQEVAKIH